MGDIITPPGLVWPQKEMFRFSPGCCCGAVENMECSGTVYGIPCYTQQFQEFEWLKNVPPSVTFTFGSAGASGAWAPDNAWALDYLFLAGQFAGATVTLALHHCGCSSSAVSYTYKCTVYYNWANTDRQLACLGTSDPVRADFSFSLSISSARHWSVQFSGYNAYDSDCGCTYYQSSCRQYWRNGALSYFPSSAGPPSTCPDWENSIFYSAEPFVIFGDLPASGDIDVANQVFPIVLSTYLLESGTTPVAGSEMNVGQWDAAGGTTSNATEWVNRVLPYTTGRYAINPQTLVPANVIDKIFIDFIGFNDVNVEYYAEGTYGGEVDQCGFSYGGTLTANSYPCCPYQPGDWHTGLGPEACWTGSTCACQDMGFDSGSGWWARYTSSINYSILNTAVTFRATQNGFSQSVKVGTISWTRQYIEEWDSWWVQYPNDDPMYSELHVNRSITMEADIYATLAIIPEYPYGGDGCNGTLWAEAPGRTTDSILQVITLSATNIGITNSVDNSYGTGRWLYDPYSYISNLWVYDTLLPCHDIYGWAPLYTPDGYHDGWRAMPNYQAEFNEVLMPNMGFSENAECVQDEGYWYGVRPHLCYQFQPTFRILGSE